MSSVESSVENAPTATRLAPSAIGMSPTSMQYAPPPTLPTHLHPSVAIRRGDTEQSPAQVAADNPDIRFLVITDSDGNPIGYALNGILVPRSVYQNAITAYQSTLQQRTGHQFSEQSIYRVGYPTRQAEPETEMPLGRLGREYGEQTIPSGMLETTMLGGPTTSTVTRTISFNGQEFTSLEELRSYLAANFPGATARMVRGEIQIRGLPSSFSESGTATVPTASTVTKAASPVTDIENIPGALENLLGGTETTLGYIGYVGSLPLLLATGKGFQKYNPAAGKAAGTFGTELAITGGLAILAPVTLIGAGFGAGFVELETGGKATPQQVAASVTESAVLSGLGYGASSLLLRGLSFYASFGSEIPGSATVQTGLRYLGSEGIAGVVLRGLFGASVNVGLTLPFTRDSTSLLESAGLGFALSGIGPAAAAYIRASFSDFFYGTHGGLFGGTSPVDRGSEFPILEEYTTPSEVKESATQEANPGQLVRVKNQPYSNVFVEEAQAGLTEGGKIEQGELGGLEVKQEPIYELSVKNEVDLLESAVLSSADLESLSENGGNFVEMAESRAPAKIVRPESDVNATLKAGSQGMGSYGEGEGPFSPSNAAKIRASEVESMLSGYDQKIADAVNEESDLRIDALVRESAGESIHGTRVYEGMPNFVTGDQQLSVLTDESLRKDVAGEEPFIEDRGVDEAIKEAREQARLRAAITKAIAKGSYFSDYGLAFYPLPPGVKGANRSSTTSSVTLSSVLGLSYSPKAGLSIVSETTGREIVSLQYTGPTSLTGQVTRQEESTAQVVVQRQEVLEDVDLALDQAVDQITEEVQQLIAIPLISYEQRPRRKKVRKKRAFREYTLHNLLAVNIAGAFGDFAMGLEPELLGGDRFEGLEGYLFG